MFGSHDHVFMGVGVSCFSAACLVRHRWLLTNTNKGQWLIERFGENSARCVVGFAAIVGLAFGSLLALGFIQPVQW